MNDLGKKFILTIVVGVAVSAILMLAGIKPGIFVGLAIIGIGGALITKNHEDNMSSSYGEGISQEHSRYNKTKQNISLNTETVNTEIVEDKEPSEDDKYPSYHSKNKYVDSLIKDDPNSIKDDIARGILGAAADIAHSEKGIENEKKYYEYQKNKFYERAWRRGWRGWRRW